MVTKNATDSVYYHHSSHATYNFTGHLVWITKYRRKALTPEIIERLKTIIEWVCKEQYIIILSLGFEEDHVHCLISFPITAYIPDVARYLKGRTSKVIWNEFYGHLRRFYHSKFDDKHLWATGYFFASVGRVDEATIKKYVENQWEEDVRGKEITL